jgi:hypothetical protein
MLEVFFINEGIYLIKFKEYKRVRVDWTQDTMTTVLVILMDILLLDFHPSPIISLRPEG